MQTLTSIAALAIASGFTVTLCKPGIARGTSTAPERIAAHTCATLHDLPNLNRASLTQRIATRKASTAKLAALRIARDKARGQANA